MSLTSQRAKYIIKSNKCELYSVRLRVSDGSKKIRLLLVEAGPQQQNVQIDVTKLADYVEIHLKGKIEPEEPTAKKRRIGMREKKEKKKEMCLVDASFLALFYVLWLFKVENLEVQIDGRCAAPTKQVLPLLGGLYPSVEHFTMRNTSQQLTAFFVDNIDADAYRFSDLSAVFKQNMENLQYAKSLSFNGCSFDAALLTNQVVETTGSCTALPVETVLKWIEKWRSADASTISVFRVFVKEFSKEEEAEMVKTVEAVAEKNGSSPENQTSYRIANQSKSDQRILVVERNNQKTYISLVRTYSTCL